MMSRIERHAVALVPLIALASLASTTGCAAGAPASPSAGDGEAVATTREALSDRDLVAGDAFDEGLDELRIALADSGEPGDRENLADLERVFAQDEAWELGPEDFGGRPGEAPRTLLHGFHARSHRRLCHALQTYVGSRYSRVLFYVGAYAQGGPFAQGRVGTDQVWDLYNQQFSSFKYTGAGVDLSVGVQGGAYAGFMFFKADDVTRAWVRDITYETASTWLPTGLTPVFVGGTYTHTPLYSTLTASVGLPPPVTPVAANLSVTWDKGGFGGVSLGLSAGIKLPLPMVFDASVMHATWTPWDASTRAKLAADEGHGVSAHLVDSGGAGVYVQFEGTTARKTAAKMARSILTMTGPVGIAASLAALAIGALKDADLEPGGLCSDR